jgi:hypothetical protein
VGAVCAAGAVALDCGATDVAGSVFAGTSAPALTLAGGDARLAGDTFVDVPGTAVAVALGSLTVDGSVFAHVGTAVDGLLTTLPGGSGNWIFDGAPGIAPPEPENPRDPTVAWVEGACGSTADLVAAAPAGFSTDPGWDADADTSPRWVDCDDHAVAVYPGAPELPGSGVGRGLRRVRGVLRGRRRRRVRPGRGGGGRGVLRPRAGGRRLRRRLGGPPPGGDRGV